MSKKKNISSLEQITQTIMSDGAIIVRLTYRDKNGETYTKEMSCKDKSELDSYMDYLKKRNLM